MSASSVVQQIGEHMRSLRMLRGLSVRTLAAKSGFSPSFISQVELGQVSPSIDSLERIATTLSVDLSAFFLQVQDSQPTVMHARARQVLKSDWSLASVESLTASYDGQQLEAVLVTFDPGGRSGSTPHAHQEEEFAIVLTGEIQLHLAGNTHDLHPDDAVTIPARTPHRWTNTGPHTAKIVMVSARPLLRVLPSGLAGGDISE